MGTEDKKRNIIGRISDLFINQFQLAMLVIIMIAVVGGFGLITLPKESLPEIVFPAIIIQTPYIGASAEDVEKLVTDKIEDKIEDIDEIDGIYSKSGFGFSTVTINFVEGVDIDRKKLEVDNALREIDFPVGVDKFNSLIFKTSEIPLLTVSISGDYDNATLTAIGESLQTKIDSTSGVESVNIFGSLKKEIHLIVDEKKLLQYGLTIRDIKNAINSSNLSLPLGEVNLNGIRYSLRVDEEISDLDSIRNITIPTSSGNVLFISDVAKVISSYETVKSYNSTYENDGAGEKFSSIFLEVLRTNGSDVIGTTEKVKEAISSSKGVLYPENVKIIYANQLADSVTKDLGNIRSSAISGLLVVILVLFLFIGFREALIVSVTIPLSLLGTLGVLNFFGITFNTFAVLGLIVALGLLVDNSIIVMENIDRLRKEGLSAYDAASVGTNQVGPPIFSATLTTVAAFFPLVILPGILGDFVSTIPLTIIITIVVSLVVSIVITPTISVKILKSKGKREITGSKLEKIEYIMSVIIVGAISFYAFSGNGSNMTLGYAGGGVFTLFAIIRGHYVYSKRSIGNFIDIYGKAIHKIITKKYLKLSILALGLLVLVGSFSMIGSGVLKISFFPEAEPDSVTIFIDTPGGYTLEQTGEVVEKVEAILIEDSGVALFNTTVGGSEIDYARISVTLLPRESRIESGFKIVDRIEKSLSKISGAEIVVKGIAMGPPIGSPVEIKLAGFDLKGLESTSSSIVKSLKSISGVYNIESSIKVGVPQLVYDINEAKARGYGLSAQDVIEQIRNNISGTNATVLKENQDEIDVKIMLNESQIEDINLLSDILIVTPRGEYVPASFVGTFEEVGGISSIDHEDGERIVTVSADLKEGYNINDVIKTVKSDIENMSISDDIRVIYSGDIQGIEENFLYLLQSMILAVFLVFIILTLQFKSIAQPFAILTTVPMASVGVILGLIATRNDFGFYAFMGLVALVGIAVNDAIVLIDYMNTLRMEGKSLTEAIKEASITRFNPVLATTMTTVAGVLPLAFKESYYAQFSFSLVFGLLVTTVLTLVYIPIMYSIIEGIKGRKKSEETA